MAEPSEEEKSKLISMSLSSDVPEIYFNGFSNALGLSDVLITLQRNGKPVATLNASYTVAKTLAILLNDLVQTLETKTGNTIMTVPDVENALKEQPK